ncbi:hypothetical protein GWI33_000503 [Rhynchophorus ferrugineus]|uniref:Uncharacterized protein n=1 Tax=Rhynchophorus ferrugineus TaxID=354439 RepID=A0A834HT37_RHYFE|nr:hypothetical protein GWI33_000503 [Rhynchophorus ferrugineus]
MLRMLSRLLAPIQIQIKIQNDKPYHCWCEVQSRLGSLSAPGTALIRPCTGTTCYTVLMQSFVCISRLQSTVEPSETEATTSTTHRDRPLPPAFLRRSALLRVCKCWRARDQAPVQVAKKMPPTWDNNEDDCGSIYSDDSVRCKP